MKKYKVVYWLGSMMTERTVEAETEEAVKKMFENRNIVKIELV